MASKPTGNPVGRPSDYNPKTYPDIVKKLAERGMTEEEMSKILGVSRPTFIAWKNKHPEFLSAVLEGKQNPIKDVEDALYRLCKGYVYKEGGEEKIKHPDVRAIQFYLKNVAPDKWREKQEIEMVDKIKIEVVYDDSEDQSQEKKAASEATRVPAIDSEEEGNPGGET